MGETKSTTQPKFYGNYPYHHERRLLSMPERLPSDDRFTGKGVVVAYLDAGFYMHDDISDRIVMHVDATTSHIIEEEKVTHVDITSWHGLMVSAIAAGSGYASGGLYRGHASGSQLVLIKVTNPKMQVKEADILRGFTWLVNSHKRFNIKIVNVSVGGDFVNHDPHHPLHEAVQRLHDEGVTVVISAGNHGESKLVPPASAPAAIIVGGYDDHNQLDRHHWTGYRNNWGHAYDGTPKPDLIAPAEWIASPILPDTSVSREAIWLGALLHDTDGQAYENLLKKGYKDLQLGDRRPKKLTDAQIHDLQHRIYAHKLVHTHYQHVDGTSVSTPIVTSVIAQMLEANPTLQPDQVKSILHATSEQLPSIAPERQGAGVISPIKAIEMAIRTHDNLQHSHR